MPALETVVLAVVADISVHKVEDIGTSEPEVEHVGMPVSKVLFPSPLSRISCSIMPWAVWTEPLPVSSLIN